MAVHAYLACPTRKLTLCLGERIRTEDGVTTRFARANPPSWLPDALFAVIDDCPGRPPELVLDSDERFDTVAGWTGIDEDDTDENVITLATYLDGRTLPPATYHARLRPGRPAAEASGIVRRLGAGPDAVDQAFTRNLHWEPTEFLRRAELGMETTEHVEITAAQAADFVMGVLIARLRPDV